MDNEKQKKVYAVLEHDQRFEICNASLRVVMVCGDRGSAEHYALLLNEAYESGYKTGFRDGHDA